MLFLTPYHPYSTIRTCHNKDGVTTVDELLKYFDLVWQTHCFIQRTPAHGTWLIIPMLLKSKLCSFKAYFPTPIIFEIWAHHLFYRQYGIRLSTQNGPVLVRIIGSYLRERLAWIWNDYRSWTTWSIMREKLAQSHQPMNFSLMKITPHHHLKSTRSGQHWHCSYLCGILSMKPTQSTILGLYDQVSCRYWLFITLIVMSLYLKFYCELHKVSLQPKSLSVHL